MTDAPKPRARRTSRLRIAGIIVGIALVYAVVVALYAISGQVTLTGTGDTTDGKGEELLVSPQSVDPVQDHITIGVELRPTGDLAGDEAGLSLTEPLTMVLTGTTGPRSYDFDADVALSPVQATFLTDGDVQVWPFDTHTFTTMVGVLRHTADGDGEPLELDWSAYGSSIPGWTFAVGVDPIPADDGSDSNLYALTVTAHRSGATVAFGIVLLLLMIAMPVLVLIVAISVYRGTRKVEATLMSWIGAMLFATIPLRGFLPGSPPIGSWIDYLIVLWVIAGLVVGLVIYVAAFLRWSPRPSSPDRWKEPAPPPDRPAA